MSDSECTHNHYHDHDYQPPSVSALILEDWYSMTVSLSFFSVKELIPRDWKNT